MKTMKNESAAPELYFFGMRAKYAGLLGGRNRSLIISYLRLRQLIGWLGILLPAICVLGGRIFAGLPCQRSISFYYHTNMRDFFCGILFVVAFFLITYKGDLTIDNIVTWAIGLAGIAVALFPTQGPPCSPAHVGLFRVPADISDIIHLTAAAIFFFLLAMNSLFLFTLSKHKVQPAGSRKKIRNVFYVACGIVILLCLLLFPILKKTMGEDNFKQGSMVLILESVMLAAFGVSWLIKGETIWRDRKEQAKQVTVSK